MIRKAASMIEMVIAIVVMGIAVSALPLVLTQSQNSNALALQQEAILATKAKLGYILSYEWDARSYDPNASVSRVLDTTTSASAHDAFWVNANTTRRVGHISADKRRKLRNTDDAMRNATNLSDNGYTDLDDFHGKDENITVIPNNSDYIFTIKLQPSVTYVDDGKAIGLDYNSSPIAFTFDKDTNTTNPTNIKMITVKTTRDNNMTIVLMRAFASNIGESGIMRKAW